MRAISRSNDKWIFCSFLSGKVGPHVETPGAPSSERLAEISEAASSWRERHSTSVQRQVEMMQMNNASAALREERSNDHETENAEGDGFCTL